VNGTIRVLVVDDDVPTRIGLRTIFETEPDIEVVAEAADGNEACLLADALAPDVVLMDVRLPHLDGISATRQIVDAGAADPGRTRVVVLTTFDDATIVCRALEAGASAVLLKRVPAEELVVAVRSVAALPTDQTPSIISTARSAGNGSGRPSHAELIARLTERERQVLVLMAQGRSNREVAAVLSISNETVKTHVKRIFMKLDIHDRALAIVAAYESGLVKPGADGQRPAAFSSPAPPFSPFLR
jgi:DNA-binding NarL/FixJ family response regulator